MPNTSIKPQALRIAHTMLRVTDLEKSVRFYADQLQFKLLRREDYPDGRFTLAFLGYGSEADTPAIELTYNWDISSYDQGTAFGHIALEVDDLGKLCASLENAGVRLIRRPSPMTYASPKRQSREVFAFIRDPDGYLIELLGNQRCPEQGLSACGSSILPE